ncbi:gap junction delta-4 protein [Fukomys damarensis]|uniref:Gap junction protein n=1 Tax=Fukomys damarensis TaxID=885580 RepID=A0A091CU60_FUKDA|nr:gap junction delta-4 protein [Fukomys damarensis]KFO23034.1 Gap junction delta-4 protein [Fukomys damarensis]
MENLDVLGFLIVTLNCNVTIVGKLWLLFAVLLRLGVIVLAGYPVYQDEQERFVCNTLQPGCANVCYDIFSPVSQLRFWLVQAVSVLLPYAVFSICVLHKGAQLALQGARLPDRGAPGVPDFSCGYLIQLCFRTLMEAAFGAWHYLLFGFVVPKRFSCTHSPCSSVVDCYVSRPTEKSILMLFAWTVSVLSFLLSAADLVCSVQRRMRRRRGPGQAVSRTCGSEGCGARGSEPGGWEEEAAPSLPGGWEGGQSANDPRARSAVSGQVAPLDEDRSEGLSSASDKVPPAHREPGGGCPGEAAQDPRSKGFNRSEVRPCASRSHLARHYSSGLLHPPEQLASAGSVPYLRTKKSEWV